MNGYLALVLHAHLPFVRHPEHDRFLEENWLFEAVTEAYIPLIQVLEGWRRDGMQTRLTLTLSPTLCSMLLDCPRRTQSRGPGRRLPTDRGPGRAF
jgi:1,4-alpha-glucan branching enzyme